MRRITHPLAPAADAWSALDQLSAHLATQPVAPGGAAWSLVGGLIAQRSSPHRRRPAPRLQVRAGAWIEIDRVAPSGPPSLAPAVGAAVPHPARPDLKTFVTLTAGTIGGRHLEKGVHFLVERRAPEAGDWVVVVDRRGLRPLVAGPRGVVPQGAGGLLGEGRVLGVVEAVVREHRRRA